MKICDLDFISKGDIKKLGERAGMTVEEYVRWCELQKSEGIKLNKFYEKIYRRIIDPGDEKEALHVDEPEADMLYPLGIDKDAGLIKNLRTAFAEIGEELTRRLGRTKTKLTYASFPGKMFKPELVANILSNIYKRNMDIAQTGEALELSFERIRDVHAKTIAALRVGDKISGNISLHPDIVEWAINISEEYLFKPNADLYKAIGDFDNENLSILGFDTIEIGNTGVYFTIPKGHKGLYKSVAEALLSVLHDNIVPLDKVAITEKLEKHNKMASVESFNPDFVDNFLNCENLVEKIGEEFCIKTEWLSKDEQRMARLIYDHKMPISSRDAQVKFQELYGHKISGGFTVLKKFGLKNVHGNMWAFAEKELEPLQSFVSHYAEEHKTFYYSDIEAALKSAGYTIPPSVRSYITNVCQVDNKDRAHFCHKDFVDEYPEISWRSQSREGLTNWILNCAKDYLRDKEDAELEKVYSHIERKAKDSEYTSRIRYRAQRVLLEYSGAGKPFLSKDGRLHKNVAVFDSTDFAFLGLKGGKYPFFLQIRSIILNALKKAKEGRILLVDAIKLVNESIDEPQSRNTVRDALINKHLPTIPVELQNIDGNLYVVKTGEAATEPTFEIKTSAEDDTAEAVEEVKEITESRPGLSYRLLLNWSELEEAMKVELSFYKTWMGYEHIDLEGAVVKSIQFLKEAKNSNLNQKLPQYLYEYWFARTDNYDRETYVSQLAIFFEGLLSEIKFKKDGVRLRKSGLGDWMKEFYGLSAILTLPPHFAKGFERIYKDLYIKRNKYAHGETVEMSSAETAKTLSDFAALYVYTIAKYA